MLPRTSLITTHKSFARPHLDYGDVIYDQTFNESFHQRIESIQHNAAIAITGAIRGTSSGRLRVTKIQKMAQITFYKIYKNKPPYLYNLIPDRVKFYSTRRIQINNIYAISKQGGIYYKPIYDEFITKTLLYDDDKFELSCNKSIISSATEFIVSPERFSNSLV